MPSEPHMQTFRTTAAHEGHTYPIEGSVAPPFQAVADRFVANFAQGMETGAMVAVTHNGAPVVDLWGGYQDRAKIKPWQRDTIVNLMSIAKAVTAVCFFTLVERGLVDPDDPVAKYWPEFGQHGKEAIPIRYVLDHRAGVPVLDPPPPPGTIYHWQQMAEAIAAQRLLFPPGEKSAYHVMNQGFIIGEIVRRLTGLSLGTYFRKEFGDPMELDYWIGMKPGQIARCADFILHPLFIEHVLDQPKSKEGIAWAEFKKGEDYNSPEFRAAEIPSAGGHGNARSVARFFGMLATGGVYRDRRYLKPETIQRMTTEQHNMAQELMPIQYHQALGVILNSPPNVPMGPNPRTFGHHGAGGSIGLADPDAHIGFCYGMNQMHMGLENGPRAGALIEATFASL